MEINKLLKDSELTVSVVGRIDSNSSPELEKELKNSIEGVKTLNLDFTNVEYISSAGLRVLLSMQKIFRAQGKMVIKNVNESVLEVFEITGFSEILTIE